MTKAACLLLQFMLHCRPFLVRHHRRHCVCDVFAIAHDQAAASRLMTTHKHSLVLELQVAGFNAHDLIEMASIKTSDYVTVGGLQCM